MGFEVKQRISTEKEEKQSMLCSQIQNVSQHEAFGWRLQEELEIPRCRAGIASPQHTHDMFKYPASHKMSAHSTGIPAKN